MLIKSDKENELYARRQDLSCVLYGYVTGDYIFYKNGIFRGNKNYFEPVYENNIISRGVCEHYADYLSELLPKVGISCVRIDGKSELQHAWNAVVIDGKVYSVDLTRAIFIRDKENSIPIEQKSSDWLLSDFADIFKMQSTRIVSIIGKTLKLDVVINRDNYDGEEFSNIILHYINSNSLGNSR